MGWREEQKLKAAQRKQNLRLKAAETAAKRKIERLTPSEEWEIFGNIMSTAGEVAPLIDFIPGVPPGSGQALKAALNLAGEGTQAIAYEAADKSELAKYHAMRTAAGGARAVGASGAATTKSIVDPSKPWKPADAAPGAAVATAGGVGAGLLEQEAAALKPRHGSLEYETALAFEQKYGDIARKEQEAMQEAALKRQRMEQRRAQAFGSPAPLALQTPTPMTELPPPERVWIPSGVDEAAYGSAPGAAPGGSLPETAAAPKKQPKYETKQLALTAGGEEPKDAVTAQKTPPAEEKKPWWEYVADYSTMFGHEGLGALGTAVGATGQSIEAARAGKEEQIPLAWIDWMLGNVQRPADDPAQSRTDAGKELAKQSGIDRSILDLLI